MAKPIAAARSYSFLTSVCLMIIAGCAAQEMPPSVRQDINALTKVAAADLKETKAPGDRKLIYTGKLRLAVKSLATTEQELQRLLEVADGQLAEFREERTAENRRAATWKVRIPPGKFHSFVKQVADLGKAELHEVTTADVTEEFVDIEARLKNKRQLESRILKLLDEKAGELKDVVTVEHELARVREDIERIEGRLRLLASQVDLSTVSIYAFEPEDYQPPKAPTFGNRVAAAWFGSLRALRQLGEAIVVAAAAIAPWAVLFGVLLGCGLIVVIRIWRRWKQPIVATAIH
ncbi:DUF4349 domain-containing protein [Anatilimnocola floriformis]|uniref:DUF4349 domain-containing protein n=1 Tax=Anatilimnocola floriformis TaxID=2948575 RepID=UPI0020C2DC52|nr:DUF4349 domain-containing protein [Anatilimnocola floriformis]